MAGSRAGADAGGRGDEPWISKADAAAHTGMSFRTIERAVASGALKAGGTARRRRFRRSDLDAWMTSWQAAAVVALLAVAALLAMCLAGIGPVRDVMHRLHCPLAQLEASVHGHPAAFQRNVVLHSRGSTARPVTISASIRKEKR